MIAAPRHKAARALILGAGGLGAILRGTAYLPIANPPDAQMLSPVEAWMTVTGWSIVWIVVGAAMILSIRVHALSIWSMTALTALCTAWGSSYITAWIVDGGRSWTTGCLFLVLAVWAGVLTSILERRR